MNGAFRVFAFALCLGSSGALVSCAAAERAAPPPAAPSVAAPMQAIPGDLDVVVRIDLEPMRAVLPAAIESKLTEQTLAEDASASSDLVRRAMTMARQVWIAFRPEQELTHADNVLVLRGDFGEITEKDLTSAFKPARDLGGGWHAYDVRRSHGRAAPARLYTHLNDLWVVASEAELDAVERVVESGARETRPEPPERGVISLVARVPSVAASIRDRSPKAARFLSQADLATLSVDLGSDGLELMADMGFVDEIAANRAGDALEIVLTALSLQLPAEQRGTAKVSVVGKTVTLHARVPQAVLASLAAPPSVDGAAQNP